MQKYIKPFSSLPKITKWGIFLFLGFFIFTPIFLKIRVTSNIFVEPLLPFLVLGATLLVWGEVNKKGITSSLGDIKNFILANRIVKFYLLLLLVLAASYIYGFFLTGMSSHIDLLKIIKFYIYFLVFPLAIYSTRFITRNNIKKVFLAFVTIGVITAVFTLARIFLFIDSGQVNDFWVYSPDVKAVGFLGQYFDPLSLSIGQISKGANATYGIFLSIVVSVLLVFFTSVKKFSKFWFIYTSWIVITFGAILYTLSRGAILVFIFVFLAWIIYLIKNKKFNIAVILLLITLILEVGVLSYINPQLSKKINSTINITLLEPKGGGRGTTNIRLDSSSVGRIQQWKNTFMAFSETPIFSITGFGYSAENLKLYTGGKLSSTHSLFFDMWARGSILALVIMAVIWFYLFKTTISFWRSKDEFTKIFGVVLFGFLIGWFIDNLISGEQFFSDAVMLAFWGIFGFIYALRENTLSSEKNKRKN